MRSPARVLIRVLVGSSGLVLAATSPVSAQDLSRMLQARTAAYELYAPDSASLTAARRDLDHAVASFRRFVGVDPSPVAVVITGATMGTTTFDGSAFAARDIPMIPWFSGSGIRGEAGESAYLAHEVCHAYMIGYVQQRRNQPRLGATQPGRYGHPDLPDWLDEAGAIACENDDSKARRAEDFSARRAHRVALGELFVMNHPGTTTRRQSFVPTGAPGPTPLFDRPQIAGFDSLLAEARARRLRGDTTPVTIPGVGTLTVDPSRAANSRMTMRAASDGPSVDRDRSLAFYGEVSLLHRFLVSRGGDAVLRRFIDAAIEGRPLASVLEAIPSMPRTVEALENEWLTWIDRGSPRQQETR